MGHQRVADHDHYQIMVKGGSATVSVAGTSPNDLVRLFC